MPISIEMPKLSDTMTEGTLVKWRKKPGDKVEVGDILAEIETDKATMEMEAFDEGTLHQLLVDEGSKVTIGGRLAVLLEEGEDASSVQDEPKSEKAQKPAAKETASEARKESAGKSESASKEHVARKPKQGERIKASPLAKKVASQHGVELSEVEGTGPGGRIVSKDVLMAATSAVSKGGTAKEAASNGRNHQRISLSGMRKTIADRLLASKQQIPHFYLTVDIDAAPLNKVRKQINEAAEAAGSAKVTVNDFVLLAAARSAAEYPQVNASWADDAIIQYNEVNLAVAVALEEGLVTPVVRDADKLSLRDLSAVVKDLANRARSKKLKPEEYQGGTLTISNLGAYGIEQFTAIINPPQAVILAIGAIVKKPVLNERDEIVPGLRMSVTLSGDHRVVDGAIGAEYMRTFRKYMENPALLLF